MKFIIKKKIELNNQDWHIWFAWYPVKYHEYIYEIVIWLQFIERRWISPSIVFKCDGFWEYRLPVNKNHVYKMAT